MNLFDEQANRPRPFGVPSVGVTPDNAPMNAPMNAPVAGATLAPNVPEQKPSGFRGFLSSLKDRIGSGLTTAENNIMPAPQGLEGMLSPGDISAARTQGLLHMGMSLMGDSSSQDGRTAPPSFMQALSHGMGSAQEAYGGAVNSTMQAHQFTAAQAQAAAAKANHDRIMAQYAPVDGEDQEQQLDRTRRMYIDAARTGDYDTTKSLSGAAGSLFASPPKPTNGVHMQGNNGHDLLVNPVSGEVIKDYGPRPEKEQSYNPTSDLRAKGTAIHQIRTSYQSETTKFQLVKSGWEVMQAARSKPNYAQGYAAADAFARITNPGAITREATMRQLSSMGGAAARASAWMAHNSTGIMPPEIVSAMYNQAQGIVNEHRKTYLSQREAAVATGAALGLDVKPFLPDYDTQDSASPAPGAAAGPPRVNHLMNP